MILILYECCVTGVEATHVVVREKRCVTYENPPLCVWGGRHCPRGGRFGEAMEGVFHVLGSETSDLVIWSYCVPNIFSVAGSAIIADTDSSP